MLWILIVVAYLPTPGTIQRNFNGKNKFGCSFPTTMVNDTNRPGLTSLTTSQKFFLVYFGAALNLVPKRNPPLLPPPSKHPSFHHSLRTWSFMCFHF